MCSICVQHSTHTVTHTHACTHTCIHTVYVCSFMEISFTDMCNVDKFIAYISANVDLWCPLVYEAKDTWRQVHWINSPLGRGYDRHHSASIQGTKVVQQIWSSFLGQCVASIKHDLTVPHSYCVHAMPHMAGMPFHFAKKLLWFRVTGWQGEGGVQEVIFTHRHSRSKYIHILWCSFMHILYSMRYVVIS